MTRVASGLGLSLVLTLSMSAASAECEREDVEFYLEKGFTHEQVAQLCATTGSAKKKEGYQSYTGEYVERRDAEYEARMRVEREVSLRNSIEGSGVRMVGGWLEYVRKQCVSEGVEKDRMFGLKSCPKIRFRIRLAGLKIDEREYKKRFLFGQKMIRVEGRIERKPMPDAFSDIPDEYWRDQLRRKLEKGNATKIPLRDGVDFQFVYGALNDIVAHETKRAQEMAERRRGSDSLDGDSFGEALEEAFESEEGEILEDGNLLLEEGSL